MNYPPCKKGALGRGPGRDGSRSRVGLAVTIQHTRGGQKFYIRFQPVAGSGSWYWIDSREFIPNKPRLPLAELKKKLGKIRPIKPIEKP